MIVDDFGALIGSAFPGVAAPGGAFPVVLRGGRRVDPGLIGSGGAEGQRCSYQRWPRTWPR